MAVASVCAIVMQRMERTPWYPWVVVLANVLISVGSNALHAYQGGGEKPLPSGWAMAVSAIPAVDLALSLHLAIELVLAVVKRAEKPAGDPGASADFTQSAPAVDHGGTQPQPAQATQAARTVSPAPVAPALSPAAVNGSLDGAHRPTQIANPAATQPEPLAASKVAKPAASTPAKPVEILAAKPGEGAKKLSHPLTDDPNPSIRALARAYAKNPAKKNAELAKQARVSDGTANRYLPMIRSAAVDAANADADEERAHGPLIGLPFSEPLSAVTRGVNGHSLKPEEN
jgi:hypothetical protein